VKRLSVIVESTETQAVRLYEEVRAAGLTCSLASPPVDRNKHAMLRKLQDGWHLLSRMELDPSYPVGRGEFLNPLKSDGCVDIDTSPQGMPIG
jgi:hypothetical protein